MAEQLTDTRVGIISVFPNPDILPEEGWSAELGVKQGVEIGSRWRGFVDLAAFIMRYDNMIEFSFNRWRNQPGGVFANSGFKSVNIGPTQITGAELTFTGQGKINELEMRILAGYTYMTPIALNPNEPYALAFGGNTPEPTVPVDFVSTSSNPENNILKYRYRHLAKADVQADYRQFGFGVSVRYNDFMQNIDALFEDPLFNLFVPGIKTARETLNKGDFFIDLRASAQINKTIRLSFIVDNLLNREFMPRPAAIGAPRRFTLQVQFVF
jgi:iron complex outermembrane receptor protein